MPGGKYKLPLPAPSRAANPRRRSPPPAPSWPQGVMASQGGTPYDPEFETDVDPYEMRPKRGRYMMEREDMYFEEEREFNGRRNGRGNFHGQRNDFRGPRRDFHDERNDFHGQRHDFHGRRNDFRGQRNDFRGRRNDFHGGRNEFNGRRPEPYHRHPYEDQGPYFDGPMMDPGPPFDGPYGLGGPDPFMDRRRPYNAPPQHFGGPRGGPRGGVSVTKFTVIQV